MLTTVPSLSTDGLSAPFFSLFSSRDLGTTEFDASSPELSINLEQPFLITLYHNDCSDELAGGMVSREPIGLERRMMEQTGSVVGDLFSTR